MADFQTNTRNTYYAILSVNEKQMTEEESIEAIKGNYKDLIYSVTIYNGVQKFSDYTIGYDLYIDGEQVAYQNNSGNQTSMSANSSKLIVSGTKRVYHNADGSKDNMAVSLRIFTNNYSYLPVELNVSGLMNLTRIPRTSSVSCNSFNIGDATTIVISRANDSFTHFVSWTFGDSSGWIADQTEETTIGFTIPPEQLYSQIPGARSDEGKIHCDTYLDGKLIGSSECPFTAYAKENECIPDVSATIVDTNETTIALTGNNKKFIKFFSNAKVTISASAKNSATIKKYWVNMGDGRTSNESTTVFNNIGSKYLSVSATDSREYAKGVPFTLEWIEYVMLAFTKIEVKRPESTADEANITVKGNYYNGSFGAVNNSLTLQYRYKEDGGEYSEWIALTPTISENTFSYTQLIKNLDHKKEYIFQFMIDDELMTVYSNEEDGILTKGIPMLRIGKNYVRIKGGKTYGETILYDNEDGSTENITLSDTSKNYTYIEIFYGVDNRFNSLRIYNPHGKRFTSFLNYIVGEVMYMYGTDCSIYENIIAQESALNNYVTNNQIGTYGSDKYVRIYRVTGYN